MRMVAVVLGGGTGQRLGAGMPKQLLTLGGQTLIERCVAAFEAAPGVDEILVVMARGYTGQVRELVAGFQKVIAVIEGGATRPESTRAALAAIAEGGTGWAGYAGAAGVAVPASDTMVLTENGVMHSVPPRERLFRCQTPQCFRLSVIAKAHEL